MKKKYLVDVPVRINIWIRPECQKKQFEIIKKAKPSIIFVQSDGGRNEKEWEAIKTNRNLIDTGIDWECIVYKFYEDTNLGMYPMWKKVTDFIWNTVDYCVFLEDDQLPSISFFEYCKELLEKYKNDQRIECICGMNHLGVYDKPSSSYFFSRQGSIWGFATWKRVIKERNDFGYINDSYTMELLKQRTKHNNIAYKRLKAYGKGEKYEGHIPASEFWIEFNMYSQNRLQIIPTKNLISNIGCTNNAQHSASFDRLPKNLKKIFNQKTYEIDFPIKHPKYVIPDVEYEKKRNKILLYGKSRIYKFLYYVLNFEWRHLLLNNNLRKRKEK